MIKYSLLKEISSVKRRIKFNERHLKMKHDVLLRFIKLAQVNSLLAADLLHEGKGGVPSGRGQLLRKQRIRCCKVTNGVQCVDTAVLYSSYCLGRKYTHTHTLIVYVSIITDITEDKSQVLYQSCSLIDPETSTKCNRPVLEILQEKPHCLRHISEVIIVIM